MKKLFTIAIIAIASIMFIAIAAKAETGTFVELQSNPGLKWTKNICVVEFSPQGDSGSFVMDYVTKFGGCAKGSTNLTAYSARANDGSLVILDGSRIFAENRAANPVYQTNVALQQANVAQNEILSNQQSQIDRERTVALCKARVVDHNNRARNCGGTIEMAKTVLIYTKEGTYDIRQDRLYQATADLAKTFACPKVVDPYYCEADPTLFLK